MGARGPLPARLSVVRGNPGHRPPAPPSLKPAPGRPSAPTWLSREAKAEWRRVVPPLDQLGLLAKIDRAVLAMYCDAWGRWVSLGRQLTAEGETVVGYRGSVVKNPAWQLYRDAAAMCLALARELALTPAARLRLSMPEVDAGDEGAGILD